VGSYLTTSALRVICLEIDSSSHDTLGDIVDTIGYWAALHLPRCPPPFTAHRFVIIVQQDELSLKANEKPGAELLFGSSL
jgi:hypothetical protein